MEDLTGYPAWCYYLVGIIAVFALGLTCLYYNLKKRAQYKYMSLPVVDSIDCEEVALARCTSFSIDHMHQMNDMEYEEECCYVSQDTIGLSQGGAKDVNNFRQCIEQNIMPSIDAITYNGLLYQYYFDTKTRKHSIHPNNDRKCNQESMLFYPTYCYAKIQPLEFDPRKKIKSIDNYEYYMSVGLNSNIKQNDFQRKHLNLVILVDKSGSMNDSYYHFSHSSYNANKTKMKSAKQAMISIINQLTSKDRLGVVTFESQAEVIQNLNPVKHINLNELKNRINNISAEGGTNFQSGYIKAIELYEQLNVRNKEYDNRVIILTDAQPNEGYTNSDSLLSMVSQYAEKGVMNDCNDNYRISNSSDHEADRFMDDDVNNINHVYTTFVGVGLDFNSGLIQEISQTRGCNYYSVKSTDDFNDKMEEEFEYMVTPLVFNVCLKLKCEGNSCQIEKVYGSNEDKSNDIINNGEITRIHTLFPSKKSKKTGQTKGGIELIKLKKNENGDDEKGSNVELEVSFEDRNGRRYKNTQNVTFKSPRNRQVEMIRNDMIEIDEKEMVEMNINFYDNTGIRKGILLCKYVEVMKEWIEMDGDDNNMSSYYTSTASLKVSHHQKQVFMNFMEHFKKEMVDIGDNTLKQELDIMDRLINQ